jgi:hypothetical protein
MNQREGFAHNILEYPKDLIQAFLDYLFYKCSNNGAYPLIMLKVKKKELRIMNAKICWIIYVLVLH